MATVCKRVQYSGQVQGVGFRYATYDFAREFQVAGYVRNLANGRVEVLVEGAEDELSRFLAALAQRLAPFIEEQTMEDEAPTGLQGFLIRH